MTKEQIISNFLYRRHLSLLNLLELFEELKVYSSSVNEFKFLMDCYDRELGLLAVMTNHLQDENARKLDKLKDYCWDRMEDLDAYCIKEFNVSFW